MTCPLREMAIVSFNNVRTIERVIYIIANIFAINFVSCSQFKCRLGLCAFPLACFVAQIKRCVHVSV